MWYFIYTLFNCLCVTIVNRHMIVNAYGLWFVKRKTNVTSNHFLHMQCSSDCVPMKADVCGPFLWEMKNNNKC